MITETDEKKKGAKEGDEVHSLALDSGQQPPRFRDQSTKRYEGLGLSVEEAKALLKG